MPLRVGPTVQRKVSVMSYCDTVLSMSDEDIRQLPASVWDDLKKQVTDEAADARNAADRARGDEALRKLARRSNGDL